MILTFVLISAVLTTVVIVRGIRKRNQRKTDEFLRRQREAAEFERTLIVRAGEPRVPGISRGIMFSSRTPRRTPRRDDDSNPRSNWSSSNDDSPSIDYGSSYGGSDGGSSDTGDSGGSYDGGGDSGGGGDFGGGGSSDSW